MNHPPEDWEVLESTMVGPHAEGLERVWCGAPNPSSKVDTWPDVRCVACLLKGVRSDQAHTRHWSAWSWKSASAYRALVALTGKEWADRMVNQGDVPGTPG